MGLTIANWRFQDRAPPAIGEVQQALSNATSLQVDRGNDERSLSIPLIRQLLLGWEYEGNALTLHGFMPAHPYLWENLDGAMTELGGSRGTHPAGWQPRQAHKRLRCRWERLPPRDRWLLRRPPILAWRPFDRWLSEDHPKA